MSNNYKTIDEMVEIFRKTYSSKLSEKLEKAAAEFAKKDEISRKGAETDVKEVRLCG